MLHTKFRGNQTTGIRDFELFLPYMGMAAIFVISTHFYFIVHESLHTKFGLKRPCGF